MPVEKMEPYKIRFRPTMWKKGLLIADKRGDKLSEVIRNAVRDYIRDNEHLLDEDESNDPEATGRRGTPEPPTPSDP